MKEADEVEMFDDNGTLYKFTAEDAILWLNDQKKIIEDRSKDKVFDSLGIKAITVDDTEDREPCVHVIFEDGTRIDKAPVDGDELDVNVGVALAVMQKLFGSNNKFHEYVSKKANYRSDRLIEEARRKKKNKSRK